MYAIQKSDLKCFTPNAESVCRIEEGSTNSYLREDRAVEAFLKSIEPKYNLALQRLAANNIDNECIYTIAGFAAYVRVCSPAGMRLGAIHLRNAVEEAARIRDKQGAISKPPPGLGGESLTELLNSGKVQIKIDPKYPQALGIANILYLITTFGNFKWEVLQNPFEDSTFFTSDFPVAIEILNHSPIRNRIIPLSPNLAIRICPDPSLDTNRADFSFSNFKYTNRKLNRQEVRSINKLIVRCAESLVFYRNNHAWVSSFVSRNSKFRIELQTKKVPSGTGKLTITTENIVEIES